ncbi:E3 ubiquitin ligase PQT3-like [Lolium rigidum]|uniref:E3 ubiquitin ligase PQT3-like n=1 Tax=Lolium rigidum TaxID=89674 RepID=UPI001F5E2EDD|nr:E3 ubiquitin ligase PQT3-like [Lolium rigidum]
MAVYYRYRSGVETFSLPVTAPSISVGEVKRLIMGTSRHGHGRTRGRGPREGIEISDAQTGEEYTDDSALVLRNTTVVVRRVAGPPADAIVSAPTQRPKATQGGGGSSSESSASAGAEEDDEAKAISAVIDGAELKWEGPSRYNHRGAAYHGPAPHAGYVCRRCRVPGHFIQHCPTNGDPRFDFGKATSVLSPAAVAPVDDDGVPADLYCKICKTVMEDAVMTSKCCFSSFCDRCIRAHIVANFKCVCGSQARADDLVPNPALRTTISNILAARAINAGYSIGSNPATETQSPAASQHSQVSSKKGAASEDSDRSESTSNPAAAPEPRKKEQATATANTAGTRTGNHAGHQYGCHNVPLFAPACYDAAFFGGMPWSADPSMYYGYGAMPYTYSGTGYPMVPQHVDAMDNMPASYGYHGERHDSRKRTRCDDQMQQDRGFKRRCSGSRSQVALVLT